MNGGEEAGPTGEGRLSSPGEFHPRALADLYVNLSIHTAPIDGDS